MAERNAEEPQKRHGCLFYGCLTIVILCLLATTVIAVAVWKGTSYLMNNYADNAPEAVSTQTYSVESAEQARQKMQAFSVQLDQKNGEATLILTEDEMNAFFAHHEQMKAKNIQVAVDFTPNTAAGNISVPLDQALPKMFSKGRYLNGSAIFDMSMRNNALFIGLKSLKVKGKPLPEMMMKELRAINLAERAQMDEEDNGLKHVKRIEIEEGQITITAEKTL